MGGDAREDTESLKDLLYSLPFLGGVSQWSRVSTVCAYMYIYTAQFFYFFIFYFLEEG